MNVTPTRIHSSSPYRSTSQSAAPAPAARQRDFFEPQNAGEYSLMTGALLTRNATPVAAAAGLVTGLLSGDAMIGLKTAAAVLGTAAVGGAGLGFLAYKVFEGIDIPS